MAHIGWRYLPSHLTSIWSLTSHEFSNHSRHCVLFVGQSTISSFWIKPNVNFPSLKSVIPPIIQSAITPFFHVFFSKIWCKTKPIFGVKIGKICGFLYQFKLQKTRNCIYIANFRQANFITYNALYKCNKFRT